MISGESSTSSQKPGTAAPAQVHALTRFTPWGQACQNFLDRAYPPATIHGDVWLSGLWMLASTDWPVVSHNYLSCTQRDQNFYFLSACLEQRLFVDLFDSHVLVDLGAASIAGAKSHSPCIAEFSVIRRRTSFRRCTFSLSLRADIPSPPARNCRSSSGHFAVRRGLEETVKRKRIDKATARHSAIPDAPAARRCR